MTKRSWIKDVVLRTSDRPFKTLENILRNGFLIPTSLADVQQGSTTFRQYLKIDLMTLFVLVFLFRYYSILIITDPQYHRLLGYLFSSIGVQGKFLVVTLTFYALMSACFKFVIRQHCKNKTLHHLFDLIPLTQRGDDGVIARQLKLTPFNLTALKLRIKIASLLMTFATIYFPICMTFVPGIGLYVNLQHEKQVVAIVNYSCWCVGTIYFAYLQTCCISGPCFSWYIGTQLVKFRLRQVNDSLVAIRDHTLPFTSLDAILDEQMQVIHKVHRYNITFKLYLILLIFICTPLLGTILFLSFCVDFKLRVIKDGMTMVAFLSIIVFWFVSARTADVNVEVGKVIGG
ncbi:hypothetical protein HDE_04264 [Halotydeus destructor]|nr:hypothetical protein HDE_04264 [Halotydeus destructor]